MLLSKLPLRLKLVIALILPMLLVALLIGDRVSNSIEERRIASAQQDEVARLEAVAAFANAVGTESVVTNDPTATREQLDDARSETDAALVQLDDPTLALDAEVVRRIGELHDQVVEIRDFVGNRPSDIGLRFQLEVFIDRSAETPGGTAAPRDVPTALARLQAMPTAVVGEFAFDDAAVVDVETSRLLVDFDLVQRLRADHIREVSVLLQLSATPATLIDNDLIANVRQELIQTDVSRSLIFDYGDEDLVASIAAEQRTAAGEEYAQLRTLAETATPGVVPMSDISAINRSGSVVSSQYAELSSGVVDSIRSEAAATTNSATTSLVLVLLAGAWMLAIAALVLRMLYRAIRSPLQRLTEQSQHIANVELPYVVDAMRHGHLDEAPETTDLVADADDEIGELVLAFNDMHRTAVALAAEQAGARKVVADMFVNLGRRNQRLVNRLLKRLTNLERDERDPDKLAGLYEIDHVVTRMRRNAESLLVLAGASQARKWDRPVEVYDIAQAALSEVEGFARVEITPANDFQVHGDVVADLTHLLAEIVENALSFSSPTRAVEILIHRDGDDHLVSVSDLGVGMSDEKLAQANERIRRAGFQDETPSEFLGHFVVGRLAARHRIDVVLAARPEGRGVVAHIRVPVGAVVPAAGELCDRVDELPVNSQSINKQVVASTMSPSEVAPLRIDAAQPAAIAKVAPTPAPAPAPAPAPRRAPAPAPTPQPAPARAEVKRPDWSEVQASRRVPAAAAAKAVPAPAAAPAPSAAPLSAPPTGSSFDYPPAEQIDPRQSELAPKLSAQPRQAGAPTPEATAPSPSTGSGGDDAPSFGGGSRRKPGVALAATALTVGQAVTQAPEGDGEDPLLPSAATPLTSPTSDPGDVRLQLSGFQSGTNRAESES